MSSCYLLADSLKSVHKIMMIDHFNEENSIVRHAEYRYSAAAVSLAIGIAIHAMSPDT